MIASLTTQVPVVPSNAPENGTFKITRKVYRYAQTDGSVLQQIAYTCPCQDCDEEFPDLQVLGHHTHTAHGVSLDGQPNPPEKTDKPAKFQIRCVQLPNGEQRLVCPSCIMQFEKSEETMLLSHLAEEHGMLCGGSKGVVFGHPEHMDLLYTAPTAAWLPTREQALQRLRIISLGSFCSMKLSIQKLGLAESHLPFDWVRSSSRGIRHFVNNSFSDFFCVATKYTVPNANMTMYRSELHSFWHDDIADPEARSKQERRIERFHSMRDDPRDLLFLRSCASTEELPEVEKLHATLVEAFGRKSGEGPPRRVMLGIVIDGQEVLQGPFVNEFAPGVAIMQQPWPNTSKVAGPTYCDSVSSFVGSALAPQSAGSDSVGFATRVNPLLTWRMSESTGVLLLKDGIKVPIHGCVAGLQSGFGNILCFEPPGAKHIDLAGAVLGGSEELSLRLPVEVEPEPEPQP